MDNLKTIKNRIKTVDSIIKATNAMKMVSTVKLAKVNNSNKFSKESAGYLFTMLSKVAKEALFEQSLDANFWLKRTTGKTLVIILSTEQGFCGSFNQFISECSQKTIKQNTGAFVEIFGKKASHIPFNKAVLKNKYAITDRFDIKATSNMLSKLVLDYVINHGVFNVFVISGEFKNVLVQRAKSTQIFPIDSVVSSTDPLVSKADSREQEAEEQYTEIEGNKQKVIEEIFYMYLTKLFTALVTEHLLSELSARTMAMDNSVKNAKDMFEKLSTLYNRIRQAKITQELTEIVSSIECIK